MAVLVDSNVILDVATDDPTSGAWSAEALTRAADESILIINPIVLAEVSVAFARVEDLEQALPPELYRRDALPYEAAFLAGKSFLAYRRRGGRRASPLPDFYIGAHAAVAGHQLPGGSASAPTTTAIFARRSWTARSRRSSAGARAASRCGRSRGPWASRTRRRTTISRIARRSCWRSQRAASSGSPPDERGFQEMGVTYVRFAVEHPALFRLMFGPEAARGRARDGSLREASDRAFHVLLDGMRRVAPRAGEDEVRRRAVGAWSAVHGLAALLLDRQLEDAGFSADDPERAARRGARRRAASLGTTTQAPRNAPTAARHAALDGLFSPTWPYEFTSGGRSTAGGTRVAWRRSIVRGCARATPGLGERRMVFAPVVPPRNRFARVS
ncbi:MAG TPA: WHG domain-containing protein [Anaeromyxobacteraceae bacterium]|nr:WHG domain-containing protein [Anaeromyxobacteraceae bacterium]